MAQRCGKHPSAVPILPGPGQDIRLHLAHQPRAETVPDDAFLRHLAAANHQRHAARLQVGDVKLARRRERLLADAGKDRMRLGLVQTPAFGRRLHVTQIMRAQHAASEVVVPSRSGMIGPVAERVRARAQADDRLARLQVSLKMGELIVRQRQEPQEEHGRIGLLQGLQSRQSDAVMVLLRVALGHDHRGTEAVTLQFSRQERHALFGMVMGRAGYEHQAALAAGRRRRGTAPKDEWRRNRCRAAKKHSSGGFHCIFSFCSGWLTPRPIGRGRARHGLPFRLSHENLDPLSVPAFIRARRESPANGG